MISIADLINKSSSMVSIDADEEQAFAMQVTAEWENILSSLMDLRDENGKVIRLRKDELIKGVDY